MDFILDKLPHQIYSGEWNTGSECRHNGYGNELLDFCKQTSKKLGAYKVVLGMIDDNKILRYFPDADDNTKVTSHCIIMGTGTLNRDGNGKY